MKNVAGFRPCLKNLPEAKVKRFRLILLAKEISRQPSLDSVVWLLLVTLTQIYNKKEQGELEKYKMYNLRRKGAPGSGMELSPVFKEINISRNGIKGVVTSQDPTHLNF